MSSSQTIRRLVSVLLIALGAVLIFFATKDMLGVILMILGVFIEPIGIDLSRK